MSWVRAVREERLGEEQDALPAMKRSEKARLWVDPSFVDLTEEDSSASAKRKMSRSESSGRGQKKSRTRRDGSLIPQDWRPQRDRNQNQNQAWVDRYCPRSPVELAVHRKKVEEVEAWLRAHTTTPQGGLLLLTGPSGCGKTTTLRVLALQLGLRVQDWTNPSSLETSSSQQELRTAGFYSSSQVAQFQEFLLRSNKYNSLPMAGAGGGGGATGVGGAAPHRKLILVEDFPNQLYRQPAALHHLLRRFVRTGRCPLVFIVSDGVSADGGSRSLFPRELRDELDISSISFNPVAPTAMMKVLTRIAGLEAAQSGGRVSVPDPAALDRLCSGSCGDIRSAINSLQFSTLTDRSLTRDRSVKTVRRKTSRQTRETRDRDQDRDREQEQEQSIGGKDSTLFLFRALGKILHCKRDPGGRQSSSLPSHLSCHHREALLEDPELVVERAHVSGEFFTLYLHQNYPDFFSRLEDVDRASEYLSDAAVLTASWTSRGLMEAYGSALATRGLLHANGRPAAVGFRPLHKPGWLAVSRKHQENSLAAQALFRSFCLTPVALQTELLPYLAKLSSPMRNQDQITFIQDVGQMPLRRFPSRLKLEMLMDKDPGQLEEEEEEGEAGAEEGLAASQPQAASSRLLLEDEDLDIEEYDSG